MSQVTHTMRLQVPAAERATAMIENLIEQIESASESETEHLKAQLDKLTAGADPGVVLERLRAFLDTMATGDSMRAIDYWVKLSQVLRAVQAEQTSTGAPGAGETGKGPA